MKPSFLKSTLSLMAFTWFVFVLVRASSSLFLGREINFPDWIVAIVTSVITSYINARWMNKEEKKEELTEFNPELN